MDCLEIILPKIDIPICAFLPLDLFIPKTAAINKKDGSCHYPAITYLLYIL